MKNKKQIIILILLVVIIIFILNHPLIHIKYLLQLLFNKSSSHFSLSTGYYRIYTDDNNYNDIYFESTKYFSTKNFFELEPIPIKDFNDKSYIYLECLLYDDLSNTNVYINDKLIKHNENKEYYSVFSDKFYFVKTIRCWLFKTDLDKNNINKITISTKDNLYNYYFCVSQ